MNKHVLSSCLVIVLFIAGCKKDEPITQEPPAPQLKLIRQTSNGGNPYNYSEEFKYDDFSRVKEIKAYGINPDIVTRRYSYDGNKLQYRYYINGIEQSSQAIEYVINAAGLVEQQTSSYYKYKISNEYNIAGYISKVNYSNQNRSDGYGVYSYSGSNSLDSFAVFDSNNTLSYTSVFTYVPGKRNTVGNENKGLDIFGKDQQLLLRKETRFIYNHPSGTGVRVRLFENEYDYTYDNEERVKTLTITHTDFPYPSGNSVFYIPGIYEYTYQ